METQKKEEKDKERQSKPEFIPVIIDGQFTGDWYVFRDNEPVLIQPLPFGLPDRMDFKTVAIDGSFYAVEGELKKEVERVVNLIKETPKPEPSGGVSLSRGETWSKSDLEDEK